MKTTLNPFENAKRISEGTGGASPTVIEEMQAEISVLGSQNETQAQDITDIKAQLTELAENYSTTEHKTGRKWTDGRDIYEKTIEIGALPNNSTKNIEHGIIFDFIVNSFGGAKNASTGTVFPLPYIAEDLIANNIRVAITSQYVSIACGADRTMLNGFVTIQYTKPSV